MGMIGRQNAPQPYDVYKKDEVYNKTEQDITDAGQDTELANRYTKTEVNNLPATSFKNKLINGGFDVWQRGTSFDQSYGYKADRWLCTGGTGTPAGTFSLTQGVSEIPIGGNALKIDMTVAGDSGASISQKIEDLKRFSGKTVTMSFDLASNISTFNFKLYLNYGSGGSTQESITAVVINTPSGAYTRYSGTFTIPDLSAKTFGTDSFLWAYFSFANEVHTTYIANVQLEEGSVATPFENRPIGVELALCQRYYEISKSVYQGSYTTATAFTHWDFKVEKRVTPTMTYGAGTTYTSVVIDVSKVMISRSANYPILGAGTIADAEL